MSGDLTKYLLNIKHTNTGTEPVVQYTIHTTKSFICRHVYYKHNKKTIAKSVMNYVLFLFDTLLYISIKYTLLFQEKHLKPCISIKDTFPHISIKNTLPHISITNIISHPHMFTFVLYFHSCMANASMKVFKLQAFSLNFLLVRTAHFSFSTDFHYRQTVIGSLIYSMTHFIQICMYTFNQTF